MTRLKPAKRYSLIVRFFLWLQRKRYGKELESSKIWGLAPFPFLGVTGFYASIDRKSSPIDPKLRSLITVRVSQINHCRFCIDLNSALVLRRGVAKEKLTGLPNFSESPLFTDKEKVALQYAQAITYTDRHVADSLFEELKKYYSDVEIVELTALIAFQNASTKFNNALGIDPQGFCDTNNS